MTPRLNTNSHSRREITWVRSRNSQWRIPSHFLSYLIRNNPSQPPVQPSISCASHNVVIGSFYSTVSLNDEQNKLFFIKRCRVKCVSVQSKEYEKTEKYDWIKTLFTVSKCFRADSRDSLPCKPVSLTCLSRVSLKSLTCLRGIQLTTCAQVALLPVSLLLKGRKVLTCGYYFSSVARFIVARFI